MGLQLPIQRQREASGKLVAALPVQPAVGLREHQPRQAEAVIKELEPLKNDIVSCIDKYSA